MGRFVRSLKIFDLIISELSTSVSKTVSVVVVRWSAELSGSRCMPWKPPTLAGVKAHCDQFNNILRFIHMYGRKTVWMLNAANLLHSHSEYVIEYFTILLPTYDFNYQPHTKMVKYDEIFLWKGRRTTLAGWSFFCAGLFFIKNPVGIQHRFFVTIK